MSYKKGRPLTDKNFFFRIAQAMTFYPLMIIATPLYYFLYHPKIRFRTRLNHQQKAIIVSNHTTFLDPILMSETVWPRSAFHTLLEESVLTPFLGTFIRLLGGMPLPHEKNIKVLEYLTKQCKQAFTLRRFIIFYPEGECYIHNQKINRFHLGAFSVSAELDIPIIPVVTVFHDDKRKISTILPFLKSSRPCITQIVLEPVFPTDFVKKSSNGTFEATSIRTYANSIHDKMQQTIEKYNGTQKFYRGHLERIEGIND